MEHLLLLCTILCMLVSNCIGVHQASFYGASYISIPLKEAKGSTDINIRFRTRLPNGLLLLAAGTTDYCVVYLQGGSVKIRINLGAGESEISSPKGLILNDLMWHNVTVKRKEANISLMVDTKHVVRKHLPGKFFELNIHFGVFLGGKGNFSELFLGHLDSFRGCMSDVKYNDMALLEQARKRIGQLEVSSITWNCATEFDAGVNKEISFVSDESYLMISSHVGLNRASTASTTFRWQAELKTTVDHCILLYNTGLYIKSDLFAVEIWKGHLNLILKHANHQIELSSDISVSDGHWHKVIVQVTPLVAQVSVDGGTVVSSTNISRTGAGSTQNSLLLNYSDVFYIGGIDVTKRARAMAKGLKTSDTNYRGCLKNIVVDNHMISLSSAKVTRGVLPGCVWHYPCLRNNPCLREAHCVQRGVDSFHCECDKSLCVSPSYAKGYKIFSNSTLATDLELLTIKPLAVVEGENSLITNVHLDLILDYPKYGIRDSGILFHIIDTPQYGTISVDIWPRKENIFTLLDLSRDKVHYIHDGSESTKDRMIVDLELSAGEPYILPAYLQGRNRFLFPIIITPINDPPILNIPTSHVLRLAQGTEEIITNRYLQAKDPDTAVNELVYTLLKQDKESYGHLERLGQPDVHLITFSQQEVDNKQIMYVHHGGAEGSSHLAFQVSDGIQSSEVAFLRISTFVQNLRLQNNTGIILVHKSSVHITSYNLSFTSNMKKDKLTNVKYDVVKAPDFGVIELEKHDDLGVWKNVASFSSEEIEQRRLRYRHTRGNPDHDEFKFRASLRQRYMNSTTTYSFRMTFTKLNLFMVKETQVNLNSTVEIPLSNKHLSYQTQPLFTNPSYISYTITSTPTYGYLYLPLSMSKYKLISGNSFTQQDVNLNNIKYRLHRHTYSSVYDKLSLTVSAPSCTNLTTNLTVVYEPSADILSRVHTTLHRLQVDEGSKVNLALAQLSIQIDNITSPSSSFMFNVTHRPKHGMLQLLLDDDKQINHTNHFSSMNLKNNHVFYIHDDSETRHDSFQFLALSNEQNKDDVQYAGQFNVDIQLVNDNSLIRSVDKIFYVVSGGTKLLTGADLRYSDADMDTKLSDIVYSCREISNGVIYRVSAPAEHISEFTQQDLDNGSIMFKHKGDEYGNIKFWVNDGQFDSSGTLEIQASVPFIKITNTKVLVVEHGKSIFITAHELLLVTNLNTKLEKILYQVTSNPAHGKITFIHSNDAITQFTQLDIKTVRVIYQHDGSQSAFDEIKFRVRCQDITNVVALNIRILSAVYWQPLILVSNHTVKVEESTSICITKQNLEIIQPQVSPNVIIYHVVEPARHGYLEIANVKNKDNINNKQFTQEMLNSNQIHYVQSSANETKDYIVFNVTNGIVWLNNVVLNIMVIPEYLYLGTKELDVNEGEEATLTPANIFVITEYYKNSISDYLVVQAPKYGCLKMHNNCNLTHNFSHKHLQSGLLKYLHDNSEHLVDEMTVVGLAGQVRSIPVLLRITINPINDQNPDIVNNTGLTMWEGGSAIITNQMLGASDADRPKETLTYNIIGCWWGNITSKHEPDQSLRSVTQNDIDKELILFRHANGSEAKFLFTVTDGLHTTKEYSFTVKTKPVRLKSHSLSNLHVFPLHRTFITPSNLLVTISDPDRDVIYRVNTPPSLGRLMMESQDTATNLRIVDTFTQTDINVSRVFYEHTHPLLDLYVNDSFTFDVYAHLADTIYNQKMNVDVSVSSGGLDAYIAVNNVQVSEGGLTSLKLNLSGVISFLESHAGVVAPVIHVSASQPDHGTVSLIEHSANDIVTNITTFTQHQIESGLVKYQHDHSDSLNDSVLFSLYLIPDYISLCNVTMRIKIIPINDQPFKLVTSVPRITVVQGENYTITREDLLTEDADTDPADLNYVIVNSPSEGKLLFLSQSHNSRVVHNFSQADVNANRVVYVHSGKLPHVTFYFRVDDGKFKPEYTLFNIQIVPVLINVTSAIPVYLQQGSNVASLSPDQFVIDTNAAISKVHYTITGAPNHGMLYVRDAPSMTFVQYDLESKSVMYVQTDMTTANDSLKVFVSIPSSQNDDDTATNAVGQVTQVTVTVQPLMQIGNFTPLTGAKNKLTLNVLDATPLAKLTNSNPKYTIIQKPQSGQIRKIIRSSGENRNIVDEVVKVFSHEEVKSGLIYYVAQQQHVIAEEDKFRFILAASIFQPAVGELRFRVRPNLANSVQPTLAGPSDPAGHEGGMQMSSPNMSSDYFLIVTMVAGIIILGIAVVVIIKCSRTLEHEPHKGANAMDKDGQQHMLQAIPIPLPRPPDQLIASASASPHMTMKRYNIPPPLTAPLSVPQCKVTPLRPVDSELDVHARYPYGASDDQTEDWSSYDTSDPTAYGRNTNLMLRKNQYWV